MGWAKVKEYWTIVIQFINTTFRIDLYDAVKTGYTKVMTLLCADLSNGSLLVGAKLPEVYKKVEGWWTTTKEAVKPSSLKHYIDTLRNVFQLTTAVRIGGETYG